MDTYSTQGDHTFKLSDQQVTEVAALLSKLEPGFLPFSIFHQVARLTVLPVVEVVPLRIAMGRTEILLIEREADDPFWPNKLHSPGVVMIASDTPGSFDDPLQRVINKELGGVTTSTPVFVTDIVQRSARGMEASHIFWVEVTGKVEKGAWYDVDALPEALIASQLNFIPAAVTHFRNTQKKK